MGKRTDIEPRLSRSSVNESTLATIALLYYVEGLKQSEIAKRLDVSRATIVNYLKMAREQNIVDVRINGSSFAASNLSRKLKEHFGLEDVYIASSVPASKPSTTKEVSAINQAVAQVGAMALHDILQPGDFLGVAWGETIFHLARLLPSGKVEDLSVCQLIGSMATPLMSAAEACTIRIAARFEAPCHTLHAPAILSSQQLASQLRAEPVIQSQLDRFRNLTRTVFSVGNCDDSTHIVQSSIASLDELQWYRSQGAVAVICGRFIDAKGNHIEGELDQRMIGITPAELQQCKGILVVGGLQKINAIKATLAGGYVSHLIIDKPTAHQLLIT